MSEVALSGADLDLLELGLTMGLPLGPSVAVVLTDPERTPIARLAEDGALTALRPLAPRPELAVSGVASVADPAVRAADALVVLDDLPSRSQVALVDGLSADTIAWVVLTGRGRRGVPAGVLLRAVQAAATAWSQRTGRTAIVVAVPWSLDSQPTRLPLPAELDGADALARWLAGTLGGLPVVVLGETEKHRALAALESGAFRAARALFPPEVLPFHHGKLGGGLVLLFTGLSGSGKSTVARAVAAELGVRESFVSVLDGDEVRQLLSAGLGFDAESRALNVRRIGWVAAQVAAAGGVAIAAPIAPFENGRAEVRRMAEEAGARFLLIHVATPLAVCESRDRKGFYAAARAGRIADFTGISSPYEPPTDADVTIDTAQASVEASVDAVLAAVEEGTR